MTDRNDEICESLMKAYNELLGDYNAALAELGEAYSDLLGHYINHVPDPLSEPSWSVIVQARGVLVDVSDIREQSPAS